MEGGRRGGCWPCPASVHPFSPSDEPSQYRGGTAGPSRSRMAGRGDDGLRGLAGGREDEGLGRGYKVGAPGGYSGPAHGHARPPARTSARPPARTPSRTHARTYARSLARSLAAARDASRWRTPRGRSIPEAACPRAGSAAGSPSPARAAAYARPGPAVPQSWGRGISPLPFPPPPPLQVLH